MDDVRNLSKEKDGCFDVVLCLGILNHLQTPDIFHFIEKVYEVFNKFAIIDRHISLVSEKRVRYGKHKYYGKEFTEHQRNSTLEQRKKAVWSSLDNISSFWFTRSSLYNILSHTGFSSVYGCHNPSELAKPNDRVTLLTLKGQNQFYII